MPFPRKLMNDGEDVVVDLHPHWSQLAKPVVATVLGIAVAVVLRHVAKGIIGAVLLIAAVIWLAVKYTKWANTHFVITTDRLVFRTGALAKSGREIPLERISDISFNQSVFERVIGTGDLTIESAGARSATTFNDIPHPGSVQNEIYRQMDAAAGKTADRAAGRKELSLPEQLEKLDELRQRGVISQAEFDVKKQQLLDKM
jgi:uncharacterized membrane protein YdbT with pleckstrin-like domain